MLLKKKVKAINKVTGLGDVKPGEDKTVTLYKSFLCQQQPYKAHCELCSHKLPAKFIRNENYPTEEFKEIMQWYSWAKCPQCRYNCIRVFLEVNESDPEMWTDHEKEQYHKELKQKDKAWVLANETRYLQPGTNKRIVKKPVPLRKSIPEVDGLKQKGPIKVKIRIK